MCFLYLLHRISCGTLASCQTGARLALANSALEILEFDLAHSDIVAHTPGRWSVGPRSWTEAIMNLPLINDAIIIIAKYCTINLKVLETLG